MNERNQHHRWPTTQVTLLERIADLGDSASWQQFVSIYGPLVVNYCQRRGMQEIDARDVAQEVMIHVSKGIEQFRYDPQLGQFRSWLGTITHRVILKHRGKHARRTAATATGQLDWLATVESWQTVGELWLEVFAAHVYRTAVERIRLEFDQETWHVFNEIFVAEESPEKLAGELKRSIGWVYQAKSKVVRRLKQEILILAEDSVLFDLPGFQVTVDKE